MPQRSPPSGPRTRIAVRSSSARCGDARLLHQTYTYVNPVSIDRCQRCHGIWVDDGELNAIIGEKRKLDEVKDAGSLRAFMRAMSKLVCRKGE